MLSRRALNRALLARQLLLERSSASLPGVLECIGGIQAQYAPSMYIGLWSRVSGFSRDDLTGALERRAVVQGTLMRATIHLVSARDYWPFALAIRERRRTWWRRVANGGATSDEVPAAAHRLRAALAGGTLSRKEVEAVLGSAPFAGVGLWVDLVRAPPSGTWARRRADLFAAAEDWLGPPEVTPEAGLERLVRRYLGGFGPAAPKDIASFGGLGVGDVVPVLSRLRLRRFVDEQGAELVDLVGAPLPDPDTPAPVRFLPTWDASLLVHARRTGILPEEYRARIFNTKMPQSVATFLVDGAVAGTWRHERGRIEIDPFDPLDRSVRRAVDREAEQLLTLYR